MVLFVFLFYLSAGLLVSLAVVRLDGDARRFFLFNAAMALVLGAIALGLRVLGSESWGGPLELRPQPAQIGFGIAGLGLLLVYLLVGAIAGEKRLLLRFAAAAMAIAVLIDAHDLHAGAAAGPLPAGNLLHILNAASSAWLAGSLLLAMILGHFYLVLPKLSIDPLRSIFRFALTGLAVRILLVSIVGGLWMNGGGLDRIGMGALLTDGIFVLQRVLFGLLVPATLSYFTWKTIEMRSTQSATGILYVAVFLTLVGEALSVYLSLETAIPI